MILCLALMVPLLAGPPMTTLTIAVKSDSGKPVEQASVIVRFIKGHSVIKLGKSIRKEWELHTNQDGIAKIPPIPQGTILIQVIAKNYQTFGRHVRYRRRKEDCRDQTEAATGAIQRALSARSSWFNSSLVLQQKQLHRFRRLRRAAGAPLAPWSVLAGSP